MVKKYMLMFSLGPVQPFIAQARKTRDLWLGSFLLSTLMEAAMKGIEGQLVYPTTPTIKGNIPDIPNKYVAIFSEREEAQGAARNSVAQIEACWRGICEKVWQEVIVKHARGFWTQATSDIWERQTMFAHCFEVYWVVVEGDPERYSEWLSLTQVALDARKRLRNFSARDEPGEKSTVSGEREALRGAGSWRRDVQVFWSRLVQTLPVKDIIQDGTERLDAIDTIKRFAVRARALKLEERADFPSTSSIATAPFVARLLKMPKDNAALQVWIRATQGGGLAQMPTGQLPYLRRLAGGDSDILTRDGDCFFPETFTPRRLKKDYEFLLSDERETKLFADQGRRAVKDLLMATDEAKIARPSPYYAFIQMDGDHMGILLNEVKDSEEHKQISQVLSDFSRKLVPQFVQDDHPGRLVYAGGDDVVALSPLEGLFLLVDRLQGTYCTQLKEVVSEEERKKKVTASMGIAIAHHYAPLSLVVRAARQAEGMAKNRYGRNALVVTVLRRSGEQTRVGCHWHYEHEGREIRPVALFLRFYELFKDDLLSPKCVFLLLEEATTLVFLEREAQASEVRRVLRRQRAEGQENKLSDAEIMKLAKALIAVAEAMDDTHIPGEGKRRATELHADQIRYGLIEVLGWLLVMVFLTRKEQGE